MVADEITEPANHRPAIDATGETRNRIGSIQHSSRWPQKVSEHVRNFQGLGASARR